MYISLFETFFLRKYIYYYCIQCNFVSGLFIYYNIFKKNTSINNLKFSKWKYFLYNIILLLNILYYYYSFVTFININDKKILKILEEFNLFIYIKLYL